MQGEEDLGFGGGAGASPYPTKETLGQLTQVLPQIEAERSGDESAPVMGERAQQIRKQLSALMNSSYL
jgi:hypothetical protein